jgi:glycosyltransferase involved in cell wall biosynthesis
MRDVIIFSGWTWEAHNVPERLALALAYTGRRILYCERPVSVFRHSPRKFTELEKGVFGFTPIFYSARWSSLSLLSWYQVRMVATQILKNTLELNLKNPFFIYPHGAFSLALSREFKSRGFCLIHICMDYEPPLSIEHVQQADLTLAIPDIVFQKLTQTVGRKVKLIPQFASRDGVDLSGPRELHELSRIPRPRLGYFGNLSGRTSIQLLNELLVKHPEWQFVSFGATTKWLPLGNEHVLSWYSQNQVPAILDALDVGLMPYDCTDPKNLHCVPLKLFDYFSRGIPVVSTPIVYLREYRNLVYLGATANDLADAVSQALAEPVESPKRAARIAVARKHSIENLSRPISKLLEEAC